MAIFDQGLFAGSVANKDYSRATAANAEMVRAQGEAARNYAEGTKAGAETGQIPANAASLRGLQGAEAARSQAEATAVPTYASALAGLQGAEAGRSSAEAAEIAHGNSPASDAALQF